MCVCARTCTHTQFTSLERNTTIRTIFFFTACVAATWILSQGRGEGKWEGKGCPRSLFNLTRRGGESCSQLFGPEQRFGGTLTVHAILRLQRAGRLVVLVAGIGPRRDRFVPAPPSPSLNRLISHHSQLYNVITAQICSSKL